MQKYQKKSYELNPKKMALQTDERVYRQLNSLGPPAELLVQGILR